MSNDQGTYDHFYKELSSLSDDELIKRFKKDLGKKDWTSSRVNSRAVIGKIFEERGIDEIQVIAEAATENEDYRQPNDQPEGPSAETAMAMEKRNEKRAIEDPANQEKFEAELMYTDPNDFAEMKQLYEDFGFEYDRNLWVYYQAFFELANEADEREQRQNLVQATTAPNMSKDYIEGLNSHLDRNKILSLEDAIALATEKHRGQKDKAGQPYILHPLAVMNTVEGNTSKMTGILHDIVEDTPVTLDELGELGCPIEVIEAVKLVTHADDFDGSDEFYMNDIRNIVESGNQTAIDVKWADISHNQDLSRIPEPTDKDRNRLKRYSDAKQLLKPLVSDYLSGVEK